MTILPTAEERLGEAASAGWVWAWLPCFWRLLLGAQGGF
jgi:hypothetical protein